MTLDEVCRHHRRLVIAVQHLNVRRRVDVSAIQRNDRRPGLIVKRGAGVVVDLDGLKLLRRNGLDAFGHREHERIVGRNAPSD